MRSLRPATAIGFGLHGVLALWGLTGCGADDANPPRSRAELDVVQVTTLTTVQASSGLFLSPSAQQDVPGYVSLGEPATPIDPVEGFDRAKVDLALLFRSASTDELPELEAELQLTSAGDWSPIQHYFPSVKPGEREVRWPLGLVRHEPAGGASLSTEWSGWQTYGGLTVRDPGLDEDASAAVASLDFEVRGASSPLVLTLNEADELVVTNRSGQVIERALLIYSHPGGVGVTALNALGPGASRITTLGPKEHSAAQLLEIALAALSDFFAASVGAELGAAMANAKSIPFLETHGFRLVSLLDASQAPVTLGFSRPLLTDRRVVVSHSEILKVEEEARLMAVVSDASLDVAHVTSELGRFSEGKLEFASKSADVALSARAQSLLSQVRGR
jgi:hypothetical protein